MVPHVRPLADPKSVVLENLAHAFTHPNILDAKLGTILYSPEASEEKKARMGEIGEVVWDLD